MRATADTPIAADEAARLLGVSRATVFRWLKSGRLAGLTVQAVVEAARQQGFERGRKSRKGRPRGRPFGR